MHPRLRLSVLGLVLPVLVSLTAVAADGVDTASPTRRTALVRAYELAAPAVVNIHGRKTLRERGNLPAQEASRQVNGMGTGVVVDERGYILTNYHVVEDVPRIEVTLHNQQTKTTVVGQLVAHDPQTDLALIKVEVSDPLPVIPIGTSCDLMPAEPVMAIGNAYGYEWTVTRGIISALHRTVQVNDEQEYRDLIQTDASINPGNSGGPLLNVDGQMIGINVAVRVGAQGIGFAIPVDEAMEVAAKLLNAKRLEHITHGVTGHTVATAAERKFVVDAVSANSAAGRAGLKSGDVLVAVSDRKIERAVDFERSLLGLGAGDVPVKVKRNDETLTVNLAIESEVSGGQLDVVQRAWTQLGLKFVPITQTSLPNSRYRGGLKVTEVRADSPAAKEGIRRGDIFLGIHRWETVSLDNVAYILKTPEMQDTQPVKFYLMRGSETLYGHLRVSQRVQR